MLFAFADPATKLDLGTLIQAISSVGGGASILVALFLSNQWNQKRDEQNAETMKEMVSENRAWSDRMFLQYQEQVKASNAVIRECATAMTTMQVSVNRFIEYMERATPKS